MTVLTRALAQTLVDQQGFSVVIPDIYTSIGNRAFAIGDLTSVVIPDSVTSIGDNAFSESPLESISIPENAFFDLSAYKNTGVEITRRSSDASKSNLEISTKITFQYFK